MRVKIKAICIAVVVASGGVFTPQVFAKSTVTVYAAASLTDVINELTQDYQQNNKVKIKNSYADSSTLAKQIEAGAPADIFISADQEWMNYLQNKKWVKIQHRVNLLENRLVVIRPKNQPLTLKMEKNFDPTLNHKGRWCTGNTQSVPVGRYAKQALVSLNWWNKVEPHIVETEDVRAALNFVARGECRAGIVYATDAAISRNVEIAGVFPKNSHTPIIYPIGLLKNNPESMKFYQFLRSDRAALVFRKYGFSVLVP